MLESIKNKLKSEPVRVRLYTLAVLVIGFLATKGVLDAGDAGFYVALAGIILAVEGARSKVTPID